MGPLLLGGYLSLLFLFPCGMVFICFFNLADGEKEEEGSESASNEGAQQVAPAAPEAIIETTVPKLGQNLW